MKKYAIAGLGEVLWDAFPDGEKFGGAPANFTCHCKSLGALAYVVSCVGDDKRGREALAFLNNHGVDTSGIAVSRKCETGVVIVTLDSNGKPNYEIKEGVAWDNIPWSDNLAAIAGKVDAVCFGSLSQRNKVSRGTIERFLTLVRPGCLRVFDINLRQHFYNDEIIRNSIEKSEVLKLNDDELPVVARAFGLKGNDRDLLDQLLNLGNLKLIALTRGSHGSLMVVPGRISDFPGIKTKVVDTVGAGDSFTAAMIMGFLAGANLDRINENANRLAAYVCSKAGAVPKLESDFRRSVNF